MLPLIFSYILSYFQPTPQDDGEKLSFQEQFVILAFGGLFSQGETAFLEEKIDELNPDLVLLCGNNVYPQTLASDLLLAGTMQIIDKYTQLFERKKTYFSALFGEYDVSGLFDASAQLKRFMRSKYFVGGVQNSQNIEVMEEKKKADGNFRIRVFRGAEPAFDIYIADTSKQILSQEQKKWIDISRPYLLFSYRKVDIHEGGRTFFASIEDRPFGIRQSGIYEKGQVNFRYCAKKIVLTASGELFQSEIE